MPQFKQWECLDFPDRRTCLARSIDNPYPKHKNYANITLIFMKKGSIEYKIEKGKGNSSNFKKFPAKKRYRYFYPNPNKILKKIDPTIKLEPLLTL